MRNIERNEFKKLLLSGDLADMVKETTIGEKISSSIETYNIIKPLVGQHPDIEKMYGIFLNSKNQILSIDVLNEGSIDSCAVYPREIVKKILFHRAKFLILVHNHPSGNTDPSLEDMSITKKIMIACHAIGVIVHDHIIIGNEFLSLQGERILGRIREEVIGIFKYPMK